MKLPSFAEFGRRVSQYATFRKTRKLCTAHLSRFGKTPVLAIIGARDGVAGWPLLYAKAGLIKVIGFEPDEKECERIKALHPFAQYEPFALGGKRESHRFYITAEPGCSSCLEPDDEVLKPYQIASWFEVKRTVNVELYRFDEIQKSSPLPRPDFVQIDVQGFERQVLSGFGDSLDHVIGMQCEAHFRPIYKGQGLILDLRDYLFGHGLILRHARTHGGFDGEVVEAEVWFTRTRPPLTQEQLSLIHIWEGMMNLTTAELPLT